MKKQLIGLIVIFVVGALFARNNGYSPSASSLEPADQSEYTMVVREGIWQHNLGVHYDDQRNQRVIMDTIQIYYDPVSPDSYGDFMAGYQTTGDDSIIMRFHLLTSGKVNEMQNKVKQKRKEIKGQAHAPAFRASARAFPSCPLAARQPAFLACGASAVNAGEACCVAHRAGPLLTVAVPRTARKHAKRKTQNRKTMKNTKELPLAKALFFW